MLSANEWWKVIADYNNSLFPYQFIVMALGLMLTGMVLLIQKNQKWTVAMKAYLATCNICIGVVFFILSEGFMSPMKDAQGGLFLAIGALYIVDIFNKKSVFVLPKSKLQKIVTLVLLSLTFLYPVFGLLEGHDLHHLIFIGTLPCATTALGLILCSTSVRRVNKVLYVLMLVWALPFPLAVQVPKYGVYEDLIMFASGIFAVVMLAITVVKACMARSIKDVYSEKQDVSV